MHEFRDLAEARSLAPSDNSTTLQSEAAQELSSPRLKFVGERAELLSTRAEQTSNETKKEKIGPSDPNKEITATIVVKSKGSEQEMDLTLARIQNREIKPLTDEEFNDRFGADPEAMKRVKKFAEDYGLKVEESDLDSGKVLLRGKVKDFNEAFKVQLDDFKGPLGVCRERFGNISVPRNIATDVLGVLGLEDRPFAHADVVRYKPPGPFHPRINGGITPVDAANAYSFPSETTGKGQGVAILQFGGGLDLKDTAAYFQQRGMKMPEIEIVTVDGAKMKSGQSADDEVALDTQVLGSVAPEAKQTVIFAPNSEQGFLDAITRATFAKPGEQSNSAISISWGAPESMWSQQAMENMHIAFKKAALKGITVFAATGDNGAKNGTDRFTADYPASDSMVLATGGTELTLKPDGKIESEKTWADSGGGISESNPIPEFQKEVKLPANANKNEKTGRGVPDVAGNANPATGYMIRVHGVESRMAGTSAVSPLYAGLVLRMNQSLGQRVGYLNPFLYKNGGSDIFRDMTTGNNGGYEAGPGWDAATGWGVLNGTKLLEAMRVDLNRLPRQA